MPEKARLIRRSLATFMMAMLAACQPAERVSQPAARNTVTPEYVASLPPDQSRPVVDQLANEVVAAQSTSCGATHDAEWEACMNLRLLQSFDRYGFLIRHCTPAASVKMLRDCVLNGSLGVDWLLAAGASPDTDFDWSRPAVARDAALNRLNDVLTERCKGRPEQAGNSCFSAESAKSLGLSQAVSTQCAVKPTLEARGRCIVDAHDAAMYGAALAAIAD
jgi:hypothetical protein